KRRRASLLGSSVLFALLLSSIQIEPDRGVFRSSAVTHFVSVGSAVQTVWKCPRNIPTLSVYCYHSKESCDRRKAHGFCTSRAQDHRQRCLLAGGWPSRSVRLSTQFANPCGRMCFSVHLRHPDLKILGPQAEVRRRPPFLLLTPCASPAS